MNELKAWLDFLAEGTGGDLGDALIRIIEVVHSGASFDDVGIPDPERFWMELEDMRNYLGTFIGMIFESFDDQETGMKGYVWSKRLSEIDSRDLVLMTHEGTRGTLTITPGDAEKLLAGEFPPGLTIENEEEPDIFARVMRLSFDPEKLFTQVQTIDERILSYLGEDDPPMK